MSRDVLIIDTGVANIASMLAALRRLDASPTLTTDPDAVRRAGRVILPGVGSFGEAMTLLEARGLSQAVRERVMGQRPLLGVCLGMQLLGTASEESPGVRGVAAVDLRAERFPSSVRVPQLGWNRVSPQGDDAPIGAGMAYFANSYRVTTPPAGWSFAETDYAGRFVSMIWRGPILACQFHPELSGAWGMRLLDAWLARADGVTSSSEEARAC